MKFYSTAWLLLLVVEQIATIDGWIHWNGRQTSHRHQQRQQQLLPSPSYRSRSFVWMENKESSSFSSSSSSSSSPSTTLPVDVVESATLSSFINENNNNIVPDDWTITSPVLRQVYPQLLEYQKLHGHVNIPLGSTAGRQCQTLRRLHWQQKLSLQEVELLTQLSFRFTTLDDIYFQVPFEEMFQRLLEYERQYPGTGYQIPKKYPADPELGAWVTGLRRLAPGRNNQDDDDDGNGNGSTHSSSTPSAAAASAANTGAAIHPDHIERLNAIGFSWTSNRKCGSKFMQFYRQLQQRIKDEMEQSVVKSTKDDDKDNDDDDESRKAMARHQVLQDATVQAWISAQRETFHRGSMSETRQHYMTSLVGDESWKDKQS